ncbi:unnamed protein product [Didymodactylos carnosus]|uniref:C2H2-type domain-containing protein n=1 Tax=Didymodactylos carnosus TaxID=1234261 RepID=A0A815P025_9BILA|nr:unnamed protein product [Didymodactylos carnosus]CAF1441122.1 unnamed protein product [Didymodactylos carnosus]CAF4107921.1 unnamed protein product [Didymodactylos carnosus]CAF4317207.1 unnamed protein product [Didymodactylos carnosus]
MNGHCKKSDKCPFRHCQAAVQTANKCHKWPAGCKNIQCKYRHPKIQKTPSSEVISKLVVPPVSTQRPEDLISFFWDIENCSIPRKQSPFDIVQRIRNLLIVSHGLREIGFNCYCDCTTISKDNQISLSHANVRIVHVPDSKPGAVDRCILLDLDRFERAHKPPATVVLISGDIDFVGKLSDLRHQAGFHVIVIHNLPAKAELKATVNAHYDWSMFTKSEINQQISNSMVDSLLPTTNLTPVARSNSEQCTKQKSKTMHECPKCSNKFESIDALRQHQQAKQHFFDCPGCSDVFATSEGILQHQKAKNHYTNHKCAFCSATFKSGSALKQHQKAKYGIGDNSLQAESMLLKLLSTYKIID